MLDLPGARIAPDAGLRQMPSFRYEGHRLAYTEYEPLTPATRRAGPKAADRPLILVHGLLLSQRMHTPLAQELAARGNRVITVDLLGHGASERPRDMWRYSMSLFARQVLGLMDHLELEQAVVGGTSLGANTALEVAAYAPERLRGAVIEMPVLDNALLACAVAFAPLLVALTFGERLMQGVSRVGRAIPHRLVPFWTDVALDAIRQDPGPGGAVLQGLFFGRVAPPRGERRLIETPALVIGHRRDPVHPFSDSGMLVDELPNGRLIEANSLLELRLRPERLTGEIAAFLDECWAQGSRARRARGRSGRAGGASRAGGSPGAARRRPSSSRRATGSAG
jgi:pimeloyl-ACP methyl ester carboxylesterase